MNRRERRAKAKKERELGVTIPEAAVAFTRDPEDLTRTKKGGKAVGMNPTKGIRA